MNSSSTEFQNFEDKYQQKFDQIKLSFTPCVVVSVRLLHFRNISDGKIKDWFDTPDPQFVVTSPKTKRPHLKQFKTHSIKDNVTKGFVDETFKFVMPKDLTPEEKFPIEIELRDRGFVSDDFIGKQTVEVSNLPEDGTIISQTLRFGSNNGELDIEISKSLVTSPDFRYSLGLCPEEKAFRQKRIPIVQNALKKIFGDKGPNTSKETPIVSLVESGGGYRAVIGMCGAMEALKDAGLLDVFTYACGLSGSSWYLAAGYTLKGMKDEEQQTFHEGLRERFMQNLLWDMVNPFTVIEYEDYLKKTRKEYHQPYTFANYFPGYLVGKQMLGKQMTHTLSDMIPYVENAEVPYPILVALHVKNRLEASAYHACVERTPYEISLPAHGISIKPNEEGSTWNAGVLVRKSLKFPIHFTLAMTGCAFSIFLNSYLGRESESDKNFINFVEKERVEGEKNANKDLDATNGYVESESDDDDEDDADHAVAPTLSDKAKETAMDSAAERSKKAEEDHLSYIQRMIRSFFPTQKKLLGPTVRLYNYALGLEKVEQFLLNPFGSNAQSRVEIQKFIEKFGLLRTDKTLSTKKKVLSFVDAGVWNNVPTEVMLRPQRTTDLMIVMDFSAYDSDDHFDYKSLIYAAKQAWRSGLEFPVIDFEEIANMPPKEFMIFPSDGPNCPTVLWFTLCNKKFREEKNYVPRSNAQKPSNDEKPFNDFMVFGKGSNFSTFAFQYSHYHFDQLRELMYYNVMQHIEEIKDALAKAIIQKQAKP